MSIETYIFLSVLLVSAISLVGVITLPMKQASLKKTLIYLVSFSAGSMLGDAFIHLIPEAAEKGFTPYVSLYIISGILFTFLVEKFVQWRHCHLPTSKEHPHPFAYMNLVGDSVHNFIDGLIIGASYIASVPVGIATTLAVLFHEIPQEIGDFGVLLHGGFNRNKALLMNLLTAMSAVIGAALALIASGYVSNINAFLIPFAAGNFIYIACSDLIPELHKFGKFHESATEFVFFLLGIILMLALLSIG